MDRRAIILSNDDDVQAADSYFASELDALGFDTRGEAFRLPLKGEFDIRL